MRHLILSLIIIVSLGSCASYQYVTLNSDQMPKNQRKELTWESDTLRVSYNFSGAGGPVTLKIFNKTDKPLYIDWNRSAIVRDGHASSLANPNVQFDGSILSYGRGSGYSNFSGSFTLPEGINLVPPGSDISKSVQQFVEASPIGGQFLPDSTRVQKGIHTDGSSYTFKRYSFDAAGSPLQFHSFLTFVLGNSDKAVFTLSHSFYAKEVILTKEEPEYYYSYVQGGDNMYVKQPAQ